LAAIIRNKFATKRYKYFPLLVRYLWFTEQTALFAARLRNDLYCIEWEVKLYYTIPYPVCSSRRC